MHINRLKKTVSAFLTASVIASSIALCPAAVTNADEITDDTELVTSVSTQALADDLAPDDQAPAEETEPEVIPEETETIVEEDSTEAVPEEDDAQVTEDETDDADALTDETTEPEIVDETSVDAEVTPEITVAPEEDAAVTEAPAVITAVEGVEEEEAQEEETDEELPEVITAIEGCDEDVYLISTETGLPALGSAAQTVSLTGKNLIIYNNLKAQIQQVAAGTRSSTELRVLASDLGYTDLYYSASELGVSSIVSGNYISSAAYTAMLGKVAGDYELIIKKLMFDLPFDLFWYDKTVGAYCGFDAAAYRDSRSGEYYLGFDDDNGGVVYSFEVCAAYKGSSVNTVSANAISRAATAKANAQTIVNRYASYSDVDKLTAYKNEICRLVSYNDAAIENDYAYGDPWQLLYVFDNNSSTNVVCEGYAKAFQYLCDLSHFSSASTYCILISGETTSNNHTDGHMWNVVSLNGVNYVADVTNSDYSYAASLLPFLIVPKSGSVSSGYTYSLFSSGVTARFNYDSDTRMVYTTSRLTLCMESYGWKKTGNQYWYRNIDGTYPKNKWQAIDNQWYYFNASGYMVTGWNKINNKWYFFDNLGHYKTGWLQSSGSWYYLNSDGTMQTGWKQISGNWFYFGTTGTMTKGWVKVDNVWYYFDGLGHMVTGWQKINNVWYYFDGLGHMQTGWKAISGQWYYFDGTGAMATGWKKIGGKWYYFNGLGQMLKNTKVGGYTLGSDGAMV